MSTAQIASSAAWVKGLLRMFESQGLETGRLLKATGIDAVLLSQSHSRLDLRQVNRLWEAAVALSGQQTLGLDRELAGRYIDLEIAATQVGSGQSLWAVLESQAQYLALTDDAAAFTLEREHPAAWLAMAHGDKTFPRQRVEYGMLAMVLACQRAIRHPLRPLAVEFVFPEPPDVHRHRMAFQAPLRFDRPRNRLLLSQDDLSLPVVSGSSSVFVLEERVQESLLADLGEARTSFRVAQEMLRRLRQERPEPGPVAASVGLTEAALERQLRTERTTSERLLDLVRRELAREYLAASDFPLASIPALLRLQDEAQFAAACQRWFGETPAGYRSLHGPGLAGL